MARLGLGNQWRCVFANDWSEKKAKAYRTYFGDDGELLLSDVARLSTADLPSRPDLVWASFPCQDLSLAGEGAGLNGKRSGTFTPFWKLIRGLCGEDRKPRLVVLENVVGAITSHKGEDFAEIFRKVSQEGYRVGPLVVDAVRFLPQSRPRLFIVAVDRNTLIPPRLAYSGPIKDAWHPESLARAYYNLAPALRAAWTWWKLPEPHGPTPPFSSILEGDPSGVTWHSIEETKKLLSLMSDVNLAKVRVAQRCGQTQVGTMYRRTRLVSNGCRQVKVQRAEIRFDGISGCLRTPVGGSSRQIMLFVEGRNIRSRLLSPREAARLMGVPDNYPVPENYNEAYHLFGDGVAVPVVNWLNRRLLLKLTAGSDQREAPECLEMAPALQAFL